MLRDAQIIECEDMPQYADMPLLPLHTYTYRYLYMNTTSGDLSSAFDTIDAAMLLKTMRTTWEHPARVWHGSVHTSRTVLGLSVLGRMHLKNAL